MREISPANIPCDLFLRFAPKSAKEVAKRIRAQKREGTRPMPSSSLKDPSALLTRAQRVEILDTVAALVDENLFGRSEMCIQFADLLQRALAHLELPARAVIGTAIYYAKGKEVFRWAHAWVRVDKEVIDGNVDSMVENPLVPATVTVAPYWGPIASLPSDRRLREEHGEVLPPDSDVADIWWPELRAWLDQEFQIQVQLP